MSGEKKVTFSNIDGWWTDWVCGFCECFDPEEILEGRIKGDRWLAYKCRCGWYHRIKLNRPRCPYERG